MRGAARFLSAGILSLACAAPGSGSGGAGRSDDVLDCRAEPGRPVTVFVEGRDGDDPRALALTGVTFTGAAEPGAIPRYTFTDRDGTTRRLAFLDEAGPLPVEPGKSYDLRLETMMGEPSAGAILLSDAGGLILATAADTGLREHVLAAGPPGFTLRLVDGGCRSRAVSKCFSARVNAILEVTHDGATVRLGHGQRARLGAYEVLCHAAERVEYTPRCADAGVLAVSWTIRRVPSGVP